MIDIVLATYNGAKHIAEQIESIQQSVNYSYLISRLIIIDDGSDDNTIAIVQTYANHDKKMEIHVNQSDKHGAKHNFCAGLNLTTAEYVMLCDQDDVWHPEKIQLSLLRIKQLEGVFHNQPLLVFTDKEIVDEQLGLIKDSDYLLSKLSKEWHKKTERLLQRNVVSGCTTIVNRDLLKIALPIPEQAFMHDWWLALVASYHGQVSLIDKPLMKYRQHDNNAIGACHRNITSLLLKAPTHLKTFKNNFTNAMRQAEYFADITKQEYLFTVLTKMSALSIIKYVLIDNITKSGIVRRCLITCLLIKPTH
jgi:glycosyltransferase involved in cell wall biosynthesis